MIRSFPSPVRSSSSPPQSVPVVTESVRSRCLGGPCANSCSYLSDFPPLVYLAMMFPRYKNIAQSTLRLRLHAAERQTRAVYLNALPSPVFLIPAQEEVSICGPVRCKRCFILAQHRQNCCVGVMPYDRV
jgi:hypothetical protein